MERIKRERFAVFTRNHPNYLVEAEELCAADPKRFVTFRASTLWASAEREVSDGPPLALYIAAVGGPGTVEYVAELCEVQTHPHRGDPKTERLLAAVTPSTADEGLWEKYDKRVRTLYAIRYCRRLATAFPISTLIKASDGTPLDSEYRYSYARVMPKAAS